jgi:hypothetical protein
MPENQDSVRGPLNIREVARKYMAPGWKVIAIPYREKRPTANGWPNQNFTVEDFDTARQNIGVQLGRAYRLATDVDLDCPKARVLAEYYLPVTPSRSYRIVSAAVPDAKNSLWWTRRTTWATNS